MKMKMAEILYRARGAWSASAALMFILGGTGSASAQGSPSWTVDNVYHCWANWNSSFLYTASNGDEWYGTHEGDSTIPGLWEEANELQIVEDALAYAQANYTNPNIQSYINEINAICSGIGDQFPNQWKNAGPTDTAPNDDLCWTAIAFTRAYEATGNTTWLTQAENAFGVVWGRARINNDATDYGLRQAQGGSNVDCPVNYNCIIAAKMLAVEDPAQATFYNDCANSVYTFCVGKNNLYKTSGKVPDSTAGPVDYTYNYGIAIYAATIQGDQATAQNMAQYLMTSFGGGPNYPYNGQWTDGSSTYNVMPYYGNTGFTYWKNDAGYNSIAFRGLGCAISAGYLTSAQVKWAQENIEAAFYHRDNTTQLMWGDWQNHTPSSGLYSWDCSGAVAGMLNIPHP